MRDAKNATRPWWRRSAGWFWLIAWLLLLWLLHSPWRQLGGLVGERLRWLERLVLAVALIAGGLAGRLGRDAARPGSGRCHAGLLRLLLLPPAALTAAALTVMRLMELHDQVGVAFIGFMAYWAGLDIVFGAYPLMEGRHYSFRGPVRRSEKREERAGLSPWLGG